MNTNIDLNQLEEDRKRNLKLIDVGRAYYKLKHNREFQTVFGYLLEDRLAEISLDWAATDNPTLKIKMQALLNLKLELNAIQDIAKQAEFDLQSLDELDN